ncbi:hypothetical protein ES705_25118 [subsurface metagenome]
MSFSSELARLDCVRRENLQSILDALQRGSDVDIEFSVIDFPDKIRIVLNIWFELDFWPYGCLFTLEPVVVWDDERSGYCGLSKYLKSRLASPPGFPEAEKWMSALLQKSFM